MSGRGSIRRDVVDSVKPILEVLVDQERRKRVAGRPSPQLQSTPDDLDWLTQQVAHQVAVYRQSISNGQAPVLTDDEAAILKADLVISFHPDGPLAPLLGRGDISEFHLLVPDRGFWLDNSGEWHSLHMPFQSEEEFKTKVIEHWVAIGRGGQVNPSDPIKTVILPSRWRIHIALSDVCDPPAVTGRKQQIERFRTLDSLKAVRAFPDWGVGFFETVVKARLNLLIAGGTGSGKTTLLRVLAATAPRSEVIVSVEDDPELYLGDVRPNTDLKALMSRSANSDGKGAIPMDVLVKETLRMSADRIFVGEVRGREALPMMTVMSSGVDGSACTLHAQSARATIPKLVTYMLQHPDQGKDEEQAKKSIASTIDLLVFMRRYTTKQGRVRRVLDHVAIPIGYENGEVKTQTLFEYDESVDNWRWVGPHPSLIGTDEWRRKFREQGIDLRTVVPQSALGSVAEQIGLQ